MSKDTPKSNIPYIHGFTAEEQDRLKRQARFAEFSVYQDVDFSGVSHLLEVGSGVGAQTEILLRRFPNLRITGIDHSDKQIATAEAFLNSQPQAKGRFEIKQMDAKRMSFENNTFEGAFICWILEHVTEPHRVLSEVRRVLKPGAPVVVTEVMNHTFFLDPYSPNVWKYWMAFNDFQYDHAGDPFVGAKLGNLMQSQGITDIQTNIKTWHFDNRFPRQRKMYINYWTELLLSASQQLVDAKYVTEEVVKNCEKELADVATDPNAVFYYSFMQATGRIA